MGAAVNVWAVLEPLVCGQCGIEFAVPGHWLEEKRANKGEFKCPNGHLRQFVGETDAEKIARLAGERDLARAERDSAEERAERQRLKVKRLRKRVALGICPCCHRAFKQLAAHMKEKHPGYGKADIA